MKKQVVLALSFSNNQIHTKYHLLGSRILLEGGERAIVKIQTKNKSQMVKHFHRRGAL
jgi:hypothetical protein